MSLRPYQSIAVSDLGNCLRAKKVAPVLVMPTGGGKTRVAAEICGKVARTGRRYMFIAPRRKLVLQTAAAFRSYRECNLSPGIIMANAHSQRDTANVLVASLQTLLSDMKNGRGLPIVAGIIVDEAHESTLGAVKEIIEAYRAMGVPCIGLTATPARGDGKGLGVVFDDMVIASSVAELTELGSLVPVRYFAPSAPDMKGVKTTAGDWNQKQAGERMAPLIGDVVENWKRIAPGQKTVVFTVTVANAMALCEAFMGVGVAAEVISGATSEDDQREIFKRHESGETLVLLNAQLLSFGWDSPSVTCCILAKPTKSIANYLQMAGRVLRPCPGKLYATLIDHAGVVDNLGFVDDDFGWTLNGDEQACENKTRKKNKEAKPIICKVCKHMYRPAPKCPKCGAEAERQGKTPEVIKAELEEKKRDTKAAKMTGDQKRDFFGELRAYGKSKGYSDGWAANQFREKTGVWPNAYKGTPMREPTDATLGWIISRQIAYRAVQKARKAEGLRT